MYLQKVISIKSFSVVVNGKQRPRVCLLQVGVYLQMLVVPRLCLSGEGVWHQAEYLRLLVPALRNIITKKTTKVPYFRVNDFFSAVLWIRKYISTGSADP
jgi:hypothetical protein